MNLYFNYRLPALCLLLLCFSACSKMDATYKDFIKDGEIIYVAPADSIRAHPGRNRIRLSWLQLADPSVSKAKIYWNNKRDSMEVTLQRSKGIDTVNVLLDKLPENSYSFDIYTYDDEGNASIRKTVTGATFGDQYQNSLLNRSITGTRFSGDSVIINWAESDKGAFASSIVYTNLSGAAHPVWAPAAADSTVLEGYKAGEPFLYKTLYLPDSLAIDTFFTVDDTIKVKGPPVEYAKTGWTATASSEDAEKRRVAVNAIDNDPATLWVNQLNAGLSYPHTLTVDLGAVVQPVDGFTFMQRFPLVNPLRELRIEVSVDNASWQPLGLFTLPAAGGPLLIDLPQSISIRYFRVVCISDHGNSPNISLAEAGIYKR